MAKDKSAYLEQFNDGFRVIWVYTAKCTSQWPTVLATPYSLHNQFAMFSVLFFGFFWQNICMSLFYLFSLRYLLD